MTSQKEQPLVRVFFFFPKKKKKRVSFAPNGGEESVLLSIR
jgi:hypothetical protein